MEGAKNVSRLGGLTLAVGLGIAVSSGQGVATADTDSTDTGSPGSPASSRSSDTESSTPPDVSHGEEQRRGVKSRLRTREADATESTESTRPSPRELSPRRLKLREDIRQALTRATAATDAEPTQPTDTGSGTTTPGGDTGSPASPAPDPEPELEIPDAQPNTAPIDTSAPSPDPATVIELALGDRTAATAPTLATGRSDLSGTRGTDPGIATRVLSERFSALTVNTVAPAVYSAVPQAATQTQTTSDPITVTSSPQLSPIAAAIAVPARIVSGLLALVGLGPTAAPGAPASPITKLVELAWVALRRVNSFFFNSTPTATVTLAEPSVTGIVTGQVVGHDKDGDRLTYRVIEQPTNGTVELHADGSFTYTATVRPDGTLGGPDTFRVAVIDKGFHLHGLLGFLKPFGGHATVVKVDLDATPVNEAPVIRQVSTTINDLLVVGRIRVIDDGNGSVDVTVTQPGAEQGIVTITHVQDDIWEWTLTPDPSRPQEPMTVGFTIIAEDGQSTTSSPVEVVVPSTSWVIVDTTIIHFPVTNIPVSFPPNTVVDDNGQIVVNWNNSIHQSDPTTGTLVTVDLPSNTIVAPSVQIPNQYVIVNPDLTVSTGTLSTANQWVIDATGIVLDQTPTSLTVVGGNLQLDGGVVTTSEQGLTLYTQDNLFNMPVTEVTRKDPPPGVTIVLTDVKPVDDEGTVAVTSTHAMSFLMVVTDLNLNLRTMSGAAAATTSGAAIEVVDVVDFGEGVVGALATGAGSAYVTVTEGGVTRLVKYNVNDEEISFAGEIELPGTASSLAVSPEVGYAYVADSAAGTVTIVGIDDHNMYIGETIHTGPGYVTSLGWGKLAVTNPTAGTVTIVQLD